MTGKGKGERRKRSVYISYLHKLYFLEKNKTIH